MSNLHATFSSFSSGRKARTLLIGWDGELYVASNEAVLHGAGMIAFPHGAGFVAVLHGARIIAKPDDNSDNRISIEHC